MYCFYKKNRIVYVFKIYITQQTVALFSHQVLVLKSCVFFPISKHVNHFIPILATWRRVSFPHHLGSLDGSKLASKYTLGSLCECDSVALEVTV